jgi:hypothetical protein
VPYEARANSVVCRQVLAEIALARGWDVHLYDTKDVEAQAVSLLRERAGAILLGRGQCWDRLDPGPPAWRSLRRS